MCPEKYRRKYVKGERDQSGVSGVMGTAVHGAQERNLRQKVVTGRDLSLRDIEYAYLEAFDEEIDRSGGVSEIDWRLDDRKLRPGQAKDRARPVNRIYHENVAPKIQPYAVERWVEITVDGVRPRIVGKIDLLQRAQKNDLKFGGSAPKKPKNEWWLQAAIYNLADDLPFGWHTGSWGSDKYGPAVFTPETAPALLLHSSDEEKRMTEALIRSYTAAMVAYYKTFGPDEPWPGEGRSHQFACGYCPFGPERGDNSCRWWPSTAKPYVPPPPRELQPLL